MNIGDKVALVTGGSGAIGGECARMLLDRGVAVAVGYCSRAAAAEEIAGLYPGRALAVHIDVSNPRNIEMAASQVEEAFGTTSILVNAAGFRRDALAVRLTDNDWASLLAVNLTGAFYCARRVLPRMVAARWGRIISIGSVAGQVGSPGQAGYAAAKAGLTGLTKALAREVGRVGVTVNVVAPGLTPSRMSADVAPDRRRQILDWTATGSETELSSVATAVGFCVDAPSCTGQVIVVDGGFT
jgi:3-oxoacyl-[acyl-carrier protein] reductase